MSSFDLGRRDFMAICSMAGVASTLFPGILWAKIDQDPEITVEMIRAAEQLAGLQFSEEQRRTLIRGLTITRNGWVELRELSIPFDVPPAIQFDPLLPGVPLPTEQL
jgi:hypothetical protein